MSFATLLRLATSATTLTLAACLGSANSQPYSSAIPLGDSLNKPATGASIIFADGGAANQIDGYSERNGKMIKAISTLCPGSLTVDTAGDLYVVEPCVPAILVYPPGSTKFALQIKLPPLYNGYGSPDVAVSRLGELATSNGGIVSFFRKGTREPFNIVGNAKFVQVTGLAYDAHGNLYVSTSKGLGEIIGGGKGSAITLFNISPQPPAGHLAVDDTNHELLDVGESSGIGTIYQYHLPNPAAQSGAITLTGTSFLEGLVLNRATHSVFVSGLATSDGSSYVWQFPYPAGGSPTLTISQGSNGFIGVTVTESGK